MEGEIFMWKKMLATIGYWRKVRVRYRDGYFVVISLKSWEVKHWVKIEQITVKESFENLEEFWIFTGLGELFIRAESYEDKEQWLRLLSKEKQIHEQNRKVEQGLLQLQSSNIDFERISVAVENLLPQSNLEQIKDFMGNIWHTFAKMKERLDEIETHANYKQQQSIKKLNGIQTDLKNQIEILCQKFNRELDIIKKIGTVLKQRQPNFKKDNSQFSQTNFLPKISINNSNEFEQLSSKDSASNKEFLSFYENKTQLAIQQQSFMLRKQQRNPSEEKQTLPIQIHIKNPLVKKFLENEVFIKYAIEKDGYSREKLPVFRDMNQKINFWRILKEFIGKDLTTVTLPIYLNEPQSFLQTTARFLEYQDLFIQANNIQCKGLQCTYILSAFIIGYANSYQTTKKPFNPLLGETYDYFDPDTKTWLLLEQVSHHPPITAYYGENEHFICQGWFWIRTKLSMSGFSAEPKEQTLITLKSTKEQFMVNRPIVTVHNMIFGEMFVWAEGLATCENLKTGHQAQMYLHPVGFFPKKDFKLDGKIMDPFGNVQAKIMGKWNESIIVDDNKGQYVEIVKLKEFPENFLEQYCFTWFSIGLNHLSLEMIHWLPSTDCRFRPDIRAYENGDLELATQEKNRLEQNQRKRRQEMHKENVHWKPIWFDFIMENKKVLKCQYNFKYINCQKNQEWPDDVPDIYNLNP